jgi:hypothetical protein
MFLASWLGNITPSNYEEVASEKVWQDAMVEEYNSILKNDVWKIKLRPTRKSMIDSRWLYKVKHAIDGSTEKYKVRFVLREFS